MIEEIKEVYTWEALASSGIPLPLWLLASGLILVSFFLRFTMKDPNDFSNVSVRWGYVPDLSTLFTTTVMLYVGMMLFAGLSIYGSVHKWATSPESASSERVYYTVEGTTTNSVIKVKDDVAHARLENDDSILLKFENEADVEVLADRRNVNIQKTYCVDPSMKRFSGNADRNKGGIQTLHCAFGEIPENKGWGESRDSPPAEVDAEMKTHRKTLVK